MTVREPTKAPRSTHHPVEIERNPGTYGSLGYRAVRVASGEGRSFISYPGSTHDERDRKKLIAQSRDFMRNNAIYKGLIERMVGYIVGDGFELQVTGPRDNVVGKIEGLWRDWFRRPEIRNVLSGAGVSKMVMRELFVAGDTAALKTDKGVIQLFEAEQIEGHKLGGRKSPPDGVKGDKSYPNGIKKDKYGRPVSFHLCPWKQHGIDKKNGKPVPASQVLFLTNPERPSQIRGVPACQASFPMLHRINDVCDSEAISWQLLSRLAVAIVQEEGAEQGYTRSKDDPNKTAEQLEGNLATRMTELGYALIFNCNPGEKIEGIEHNIPGKNFPESVRMFLRLLGLPVGCPLELTLLDWTKSNYSQSRAVLEQAYQTFIGWQKLLIDFFYRPLFEWKLEGWRKAGLLGKKVKMQANWITPTFPWIDQKKEAEAQAMKVDRAFTTHAAICKSLKSDSAEVVAQRVKEVTEAIAKAQQIEKDTGVEVPWEIFCGLAAPKAAPAKAEPPDDDGDDDKKENDDDA